MTRAALCSRLAIHHEEGRQGAAKFAAIQHSNSAFDDPVAPHPLDLIIRV